MPTSRSLFIVSVAVVLAAFAAEATAARTQKKILAFEQVFMRGEPKLLGELPRVEEWLDEDHYLEFEAAEGVGPRLMKVNAATGESTVYVDYPALAEKLPEGFSLEGSVARTRDYTGFLFDHEGDLYYFSAQEELFKRLTDTRSREKNPAFSPDGARAAYTRDNNLYVIEIETGLERQLTGDGPGTVYSGRASWVYFEEIFNREYRAFWWSPDGEMIAFLRFDDGPVPEFPLFRADGAHGELELQRYPKAGDPNPKVRLGIFHLERRAVVWVDTGEDADHYLAWPAWSPDGGQLLFQWMNRGQDNIKIYAADPATGRVKEIYDEKQQTWVEFFEDLYIFEDGGGFLVRSDRSGWPQLYYYASDGRLKRSLTKGARGAWDIVLVDEKNGTVYFHGPGEESTARHLYRVGLNGKNLKRLTREPGTHRCMVSPAGRYFIDSYSNINQPARMTLHAADGEPVRVLGDRRLPILDEYDLGKVELFAIPSGDGHDLPAVWTLPSDFDQSKKYPVIFSIYGGPGTSRVADSFGRLSAHFFAQHGIITISVDHRGSGHFGKQGAALMHRNLGTWELHDLIAAANWLRELPFIDPARIGITGGSYGGYVTCMAMTRGADHFTHGIAHFPVTDWKLYDSIYTERYMDSPAENPAGYEFASVMTHAENYRGRMLITHGTLDDNVHMQHTIQLIDRLEDLGKDFELMLYPNARHGFPPSKRGHAERMNVRFWFRHFLKQEFAIEETGADLEDR